MFSRDSDKPYKTSTSSSSVIGKEMQINGNIKCSGTLVLKGKVKGNVECDNINIASDGILKGNIKALQSSIGGNLVGDVFADALSIESTANIKGKLHYNNLKAQPGANLEVELIRGLENPMKIKEKVGKKKGK